MEVLGPDQRAMAAALEVRAARAGLLAGNVANADTPGYRARDINFKDALADVLDNGAASPTIGVTSAVSYDRNDVDVNEQLARAYENSLNYVATLKLYGDSMERLANATSGS
jgi:flagellar basal-body rod protein FlgB